MRLEPGSSVTKPETVPPDEQGNCPEGYELGDDGMCHEKGGKGSHQARVKAPNVTALADAFREMAGVAR